MNDLTNHTKVQDKMTRSSLKCVIHNTTLVEAKDKSIKVEMSILGH